MIPALDRVMTLDPNALGYRLTEHLTDAELRELDELLLDPRQNAARFAELIARGLREPELEPLTVGYLWGAQIAGEGCETVLRVRLPHPATIFS